MKQLWRISLIDPILGQSPKNWSTFYKVSYNQQNEKQGNFQDVLPRFNKFFQLCLKECQKAPLTFSFCCQNTLGQFRRANRYLLEKGHFDIKIKNIRECSDINETIGDFEKTIKPWGIKASYMISIWSNLENVCGISC